MKQKKKLKLMKLKEKRKQKKLQHKLDSDADKEEFSKDSIEFGEVVHRPPQLSVLPRKVAQSGFQNRVCILIYLCWLVSKNSNYSGTLIIRTPGD